MSTFHVPFNALCAAAHTGISNNPNIARKRILFLANPPSIFGSGLYRKDRSL
jgi:hypothetical protein